MSQKTLPKINRLTPKRKVQYIGGSYDFVFSSEITDWYHNRQLETKRTTDRRRYNENGQRKSARAARS